MARQNSIWAQRAFALHARSISQTRKAKLPPDHGRTPQPCAARSVREVQDRGLQSGSSEDLVRVCSLKAPAPRNYGGSSPLQRKLARAANVWSRSFGEERRIALLQAHASSLKAQTKSDAASVVSAEIRRLERTRAKAPSKPYETATDTTTLPFLSASVCFFLETSRFLLGE